MKVIRDLDKLRNDSKEFAAWINSIKSLNENLEAFLEKKRDTWTEQLQPLNKMLKGNRDELIELQSLTLSYRHQIAEEIATFMNKLSSQMIMLRQAKADRFLFYATGFNIKTNLGEKKLLYDAELAELDRNKEMLEIYLEFIRTCKDLCDNLNWAVKNRIALMSITE